MSSAVEAKRRPDGGPDDDRIVIKTRLRWEQHALELLREPNPPRGLDGGGGLITVAGRQPSSAEVKGRSGGGLGDGLTTVASITSPAGATHTRTPWRS